MMMMKEKEAEDYPLVNKLTMEGDSSCFAAGVALFSVGMHVEDHFAVVED